MKGFNFMKTLAGLAIALSISSYAQSDETVAREGFKIINSTYPDEVIEVKCKNSECDTFSIGIVGEEPKNFSTKSILNRSQMSTGNLRLDCGSNSVPFPGAPCFGLTRATTSNASRLIKEGRHFEGAGNLLLTPFFLLVDTVITATLVFPLAQLSDMTERVNIEISREEKGLAKKRLRNIKRLRKLMKEIEENGTVQVNDRKFDKIYRTFIY